MMPAYREICVPTKFHKCMNRFLHEINTPDESLYVNDGSWLYMLATHFDLGEPLLEDKHLSHAESACYP
jgi:hypothetical protein